MNEAEVKELDGLKVEQGSLAARKAPILVEDGNQGPALQTSQAADHNANPRLANKRVDEDRVLLHVHKNA